MTNKYDDIINLPRHVSPTRPRMSTINRAAQFSPFAALAGHYDAVKETERLTHERAELSQDMKEVLSRRLQVIAERLCEKPEIKITSFQPDEKKQGGTYLTAVGTVKKIDEYKRVVVMDDENVIPIDEIFDIDGYIFNK